MFEYEETQELAKALEMKKTTLRDEIYNCILPKFEEHEVENFESHFIKFYTYYLSCPQDELAHFNVVY